MDIFKFFFNNGDNPEKPKQPKADFGFLGKPTWSRKDGQLNGGRTGVTGGGQRITSRYDQDNGANGGFHDLACQEYLKAKDMNIPKKEKDKLLDRLFQLFIRKPKSEENIQDNPN